MVGLTSLILPVLLSAVVVFLASAVFHMVLRYHGKDFAALPDEDRVAKAMRDAGVGPGNYHLPHAGSMKALQSPEIQEKYKRGPVGFVTVIPSGLPTMGKSLALWFAYCIVIGVLVAYVTGRTLGPGTDYLHVFRIAGTVAFLCHAGADPMASIWFGRKWSTTFKHMGDGLVYGLLTGGVFGWLWPS